MKIKINLYSGETFYTNLESYESIKDLAYKMENAGTKYLYSNDFIIKAADIKSIVRVEKEKQNKDSKTVDETFNEICVNWRNYTADEKERVVKSLAGNKPY